MAQFTAAPPIAFKRLPPSVAPLLVLLWALTGLSRAQVLTLPPRAPGALTGSQILPLIAGRSVADREALIWNEISNGNIPGFLRALIPVTSQTTSGGTTRTVTYWVAPDYLAVGSDADFFRMPMTPRLGQQLADLTNCSLPTRKMVDAIHAAAPIHLAPSFFSPTTFDILSPAIFYQHHLRIESQRFGQALGPLVSGIKKDVVISPLIAAWPGRVVIYGWHLLQGGAIQPLSKVHFDGYADYSHGIRLVQRDLRVDGSPADLHAVLNDPLLAGLVSDEGPFSSVRYPVPPPPASFPFIDAFSATGPSIASWTHRFTPPQTIAHSPPSPGGDGFVVQVHDPAGGTDTIRLGTAATTDCVVQADLYCEFRPGIIANGYERIGIFARDRAQGSFDGTQSTPGECYALTWDSNDGRLRCMRASGGVLTDLSATPIYLPSTAWRRFRIEARGSQLSFRIDGEVVLLTQDSTHPSGSVGIGYHEYFAANSAMRGTRADNFFAALPDALRTRIHVDALSGALEVSSGPGVPGDHCFRGITLSPGAFPNGPFFGIDLSVPDVIQLYRSGHPAFVGIFDGGGEHTFVLPPPLPSALTLHAVSLHIDAAGHLLGVSPPIAFSLL